MKKRESCPVARFIGKRYLNGPNWGEWWSNGWFEKLEAVNGLLLSLNAASMGRNERISITGMEMDVAII